MTEAEKRAEASLAYWLETLHPEVQDPASFARAFLTTLEECGLQITEKPQRKPLPDAPGWWWIHDPVADYANGQTRAVLVARVNGGLCLMLGPMAVPVLAARDRGIAIGWAEGPLEVPE